MIMGPACQVAKVLGHSWWPSPHWWLSLAAADQAAWISGLGAMAAGFAAAWAARTATKLAMLPIVQRERERLTTCRSIAPAVGPELRRAAEEADSFANMLAHIHSVSDGQTLLNFLRGGFLLRTTMLERSIEKFDLFGSEDGAMLGAATASILDLRSRVEYWIRKGPEAPKNGAFKFWMDDIKRLRPIEAEARMVVDQVLNLEPLLEKYGGGKTHYEV